MGQIASFFLSYTNDTNEAANTADAPETLKVAPISGDTEAAKEQ